jgi:hypothetical protein
VAPCQLSVSCRVADDGYFEFGEICFCMYGEKYFYFKVSHPERNLDSATVQTGQS